MKRGRKKNKRWRQTLGMLCSLSLALSVFPAMPLKAVEAEGQAVLSEEEIAGSMEQAGENLQGGTQEPVQGENLKENTEEPVQGENPKENTEEPVQGENPKENTEEPVQGENPEENIEEPVQGENPEEEAEKQGENLNESTEESGQIERDTEEPAENIAEPEIPTEPKSGVETETGEDTGSGDAGADMSELSDSAEDTGGSITVSDGDFFYTDAEGNEFAYILDVSGNATVTGITVSGNALVIPEWIDGAYVTSVSNNSGCVVSNPEIVIPSLYINCNSVGAKAFSGLVVGTLTIGEKVSYFAESSESSDAIHYWNQFAGADVEILRIEASNLAMEHTVGKGLSNELHPPFEGAKVGKLTIGTDVETIPEYLLYKATMEMEELTVNAAAVGAYAFAGDGISIGKLTLGSGTSVLKEDYYSSPSIHYWNQFAGADVKILRIDTSNLAVEHTAGKGSLNELHPPFEGAKVGKLEIGTEVEVIPEYLLYKAVMEMEEMTVNAAAVGAYAFAGGGISIGTLTLGSGASVLKEDYYSSSYSHYWNQFAGAAIRKLKFCSPGLSMEHAQESGLSNEIHPPFEGAAIGEIEIAEDVGAIPEYFLYQAVLSMDELEIRTPEIGAYAFAGENISIGTLTIGIGVTLFAEDYYSSASSHYWNQFAGTTVGTLRLNAEEITTVHTAAKGLSNYTQGPFDGASIGTLEIGSEVNAIPEYFLYQATMSMDELEIQTPKIGAYAFAGKNISIGTLTIGTGVTLFAEDYYSSASSHYWNQFAGTTVGTLRLNAEGITTVHTAAKGLSNYTQGPFDGASVGTLEIGSEVNAIPEYFLYQAAMSMDELEIQTPEIGAYAFAGKNISIGTLTIGTGVTLFTEDYYSSASSHYWNQFAGITVGTLRLNAEGITTVHTAAKGLSNYIQGPFDGAAVGTLEIGSEVSAIPEYFLYQAAMSMDELEIQTPEIGAYAFSGKNISFGTLTVGKNFAAFKECYYSTPNTHYWNQFMGSSIGHLIYAADESATVNDRFSYTINSTYIYGPFQNAEVGGLTIRENVGCIPDYFLYNANIELDALRLDVPVIGAMAFMGKGVAIHRLIVGENVSHFASAGFSTSSSLYWNQFNGATLGAVEYHAKSAVLDNLKENASYYYTPFYRVKIESLQFGDGVDNIPDYCFYEAVLEQDELVIHAGTVGGSAFFSPNISIGKLTVGKETEKFSCTKSRNGDDYRQFGNVRIGELIFEAQEVETGVSCAAGPFEKAQIGNVAFGGEVTVIPNFLLYNAKITFEDFSVSVPVVGCYSFSSGDISFGSLTIEAGVCSFPTNGRGYSNAFSNCNIGKLYYNAAAAQLGTPGSGEYGPFYGAVLPDIAIGEGVRYIDRKFFRENSFSDCSVCPVEASEEFLAQQLLKSCLPSAVNLHIHHNSGFAAFFTAKAENTEWMCGDFYEISYGEKVYDEELEEYRIEVIKHCPVCGYTEGGIEDLDESYDVRLSIPVEVPLTFSQDTKTYRGSGTVYAYGRLGNAYDGVRLSVDSDAQTYGIAEAGGKKIDISPFLSVGFLSGKEAAFTPAQVAENFRNFSNGNMDSLYTDKLEVSVVGSAFLAGGAGEYSIPIPLRIWID